MILLAMRRSSLKLYRSVSQHRWPLHPLLEVYVTQPGRGVLKRCVKRAAKVLQQLTIAYWRSVLSRALQLGHLESKIHELEGKVDHLIDIREATSPEKEPLTEACQVGRDTLFFSYPSYRAGMADAVWRMEHDYYLTSLVSFRPGDTVIDIGAHVGVLSIALAKKYPFITVYALEPDPLNYASLQQNILRNGVRNVIALPLALSADGLPHTLYTSARDSAWATSDGRMVPPHRVLRGTLADTITLERLFQKCSIAHCRLLKVTAPGVSYTALEAFRKKGAIDLLCGEINLQECSKAKLKMVSWQIARQHFWRTIGSQHPGAEHAWTQQLPREGDFGSAAPSRTRMPEVDKVA
jgi:FkbM family methyltransferase